MAKIEKGYGDSNSKSSDSMGGVKSAGHGEGYTKMSAEGGSSHDYMLAGAYQGPKKASGFATKIKSIAHQLLRGQK